MGLGGRAERHCPATTGGWRELLAAAATAFDAGVTAHDLVVVVDQPEEDDGERDASNQQTKRG